MHFEVAYLLEGSVVLFGHRVEQFGARREFLDQANRLAQLSPALALQLAASFGAAAALLETEVLVGAAEQLRERAEIVWQASRDAVAVQTEAVHDVDLRVDRHFAVVDAFEHAGDTLLRPPAEEDGAAVAPAGNFEPGRQREFLFAVEKGDGAHLLQV